MVSDDLIAARTAENKAQRKYDKAAVVFSALLTTLAVTIPIILGVFAFLATRFSEFKQRAETTAMFYEDRSFEALGECLDRPSAVAKIYCDHFWSSSDIASELLDVANSDDQVANFALAALMLTVGVFLVVWTAHRRLAAVSDELGDAQVKRIEAEAEAKAEVLSEPRSGREVRERSRRRVAGHRRRNP